MIDAAPSRSAHAWWGISTLDPHDLSAHVTVAWIFEGSTSAEEIAERFTACVVAHPTLQTSIEPHPDTLVLGTLAPSAYPSVELNVGQADLIERPEPVIQRSHHTPLFSSNVPLHRASLTAMSGDRLLFTWTAHRMICEREDLGRWVRWIASPWRSGHEPEQTASPSAPRQTWPDDDALRAFGTDLRPRLAWPALRHGSDTAPASFPCTADGSWRATVDRYAQASGVSSVDVLAACWLAVLHRWTRQERLSLNLMSPTQAYPSPLNISVSSDLRWVDLITRVVTARRAPLSDGSRPWEAIRHRLVALGCLSVDDAVPSVALEIEDDAQRELRWAEGSARCVEAPGVHEPEGLLLRQDVPGRLWLFADGARCSGGTLKTLAEAVVSALDRATSQPHSTLAELGWSLDPDRTAALSGVPLSAHHPRALPPLFTRVAQDRADDIALVGGGTHLTYWGLDTRSTRLAYAMESTLDRPLGRGDVIALCSYVAPDVIAAMLAVLKLGATFTVLRSDEEQEVQHRILASVTPCMVVGSADDLARLNLKAELPTLVLDGKGVIRGQPDTPLERPCQPEDVAQLLVSVTATGSIHTTRIPHRAIARLASGMGPHALNARDRVAQVTSLASSGAILEVWGALLRGATLQWLPPELLQDAGRLMVELEQGEISVLRVTAARLDSLLRVSPNLCAPLRMLLIDGGDISPHLTSRVLQAPGGRPTTTVRVVGGPETAGLSLSVALEHSQEGRMSPLGQPITATTCQLLDRDLTPLPPGVVGRLFIGGEATALAALPLQAEGDAEVTVMVPDPVGMPTRFLVEPLLVDTGLDAFYDEHGVIWPASPRGEHADSAKYRVLPWVLEHPSVAQAAWVQDQRGALLAVVYAGDRRLSDHALRGHLLTGLRTWELPSHRLTVFTIPLNAEDRLDHESLREIADATPQVTQAMASDAPHSTWVSETVSHLLDLEAAVELNRPLTTLGWHIGVAVEFASAMAIRGLSSPPARALHRARDLAELITITQPDSAPVRASSTPASIVRRDLPMSPIQAGEWERVRRGLCAFDVLLIRLDMHLDAELWLLCLDDVLDRFVSPWLYPDLEAPRMVRQSSRAVQVTRMDLTHLDEAAAEAQLSSRMARMSTGGLVNRLPMIDFCLAQTSRTTWQMGMAGPSLLVDDVGLRCLAHALWEAYSARLSGLSASPRPTALQDIEGLVREGHASVGLDDVERGCEVLVGRDLGPHGHALPSELLAERVHGRRWRLDPALVKRIDQVCQEAGLHPEAWFCVALHLTLMGLHDTPRSSCFTIAHNRERSPAIEAIFRQRGFAISTLSRPLPALKPAVLYEGFLKQNNWVTMLGMLPSQPIEAVMELTRQAERWSPSVLVRLLTPLVRLLHPGRGTRDLQLRLGLIMRRWRRGLARLIGSRPRSVQDSGWTLSYRVDGARLPSTVSLSRPPVTVIGLNPNAGALLVTRSEEGLEVVLQGPYQAEVIGHYVEALTTVMSRLTEPEGPDVDVIVNDLNRLG